MGQILFSVIVPVYNMEKFLARCLDSLIGQSYPYLEIILVDDGSKDLSGQICDDYGRKDSRIKVIHKKNEGVSEARNSGLDIATGDYLSFVDPDDWVETGMYRILSENIDRYQTDIIKFNAKKGGGILNPIDLDGVYKGQDMTDKVVLPMIGAETYGGPFYMGVPWLYVFRREVLKQNNIRFNKKLHRCEDRLFCITSLLHSNSILFIGDVFYHYEVNAGSLSTRFDPLRWQQELMFLDEVRNEYNRKLNPEEKIKADERIKTDYILRAIVSIDNIFFSANNNSFGSRYKAVKQIMNEKHVREYIKHSPKEKLGLKGNILYACLKYNQPFLLTFFQTLLVVKNK